MLKCIMGQTLSIFHASVKQKIDEGLGLDEFHHLEFEKHDLDRFHERLRKYGYTLESENSGAKFFIKLVANSTIQVSVYSSEISFNVPYGSMETTFEALQDASELSDSDDMILYDHQTGEWM